ncbi:MULTISPECIES: phage tail tube protein [unclassified Halomonas]|uniref:phage tail tube protein n=1 Tax=unclassified Halomonas TaxID=2609666 RepID=UPI0020767C60|nr:MULTISPECIES: phage tail tube protein [unclassified Halomonas]
MAASNLVRIAYRAAGSSGPWQILRRTNDALTAGTEVQRSDEIRSDRQRSGQKVTTITAGGTLDVELSAGSYDDFLAAALCTSWVDNVLTVGTTPVRFDVLKSYMDSDEHIMFTDMEVGQFSISADSGQKITGQITFMGRAVDADYDPSSDTFLDETTTIIFDASSNLNGVLVDGAPLVNTCFKSLGLTINANLQTDQCIGSQFQNHFLGSSDITTTGTVRMASSSLDLWRRSIANEPIEMSFMMGANGYTYDFALGHVDLSTEPPSGALDAILDMSIEGTAAVAENGEMITVTRTVPAEAGA